MGRRVFKVSAVALLFVGVAVVALVYFQSNNRATVLRDAHSDGPQAGNSQLLGSTPETNNSLLHSRPTQFAVKPPVSTKPLSNSMAKIVLPPIASPIVSTNTQPSVQMSPSPISGNRLASFQQSGTQFNPQPVVNRSANRSVGVMTGTAAPIRQTNGFRTPNQAQSTFRTQASSPAVRPARLNQTSGFNSRVSSNRLSTPTSPPTLMEHVIQNVPSSAGEIEALIRASYKVPEEHTELLVKLFGVADISVESVVAENELTITASPEVHAAISRFVTTFLENEKSQPYVAPNQNHEAPVRVNGNRTLVIRQTSYEENFEPENFGFSRSAQNVKVLLRANYVLEQEQADSLSELLACKTKLVLETKCSNLNVKVELPAQANGNADLKEEAGYYGTDKGAEIKSSEDGDEFQAESTKDNVADLSDEATIEVAKKQVSVTTTKLGQVAVAELVNALFDTENEKQATEKRAAKNTSQIQPLERGRANTSPSFQYGPPTSGNSAFSNNKPQSTPRPFGEAKKP